jgi:threonylcarbamoyladenosine tRNA methylthiotransferase MtaB
MADAVDQVRRIVDHGGREVVLTGVDLTAYGRDLSPSSSLGRLVQAILRRVPDLARLRLSSIDSIEADAALWEAIAGENRLMPHFHLSLQAGDDLILKRMKRRHGRDDAIRFCEAVRRLRPDAVFGADLIAGFPTETEEQFTRSLDLVAECGLTHLHVFPYSPRPGTPAARMPPVAGDVIRERAARLRNAGAAALTAHLAGEVGRTQRVLTERGGMGRTEGFTPVRLAVNTPPGELRDVTIAGHDGRVLIGAE